MVAETLNAKKSGKLPYSTKAGYGIAAMADSIGPGIVGSFFMWFLTDIVGIEPVFAGTITLIAVLWDAITDPLIGHFSDNCRSKFGRRRPFLFMGGILMTIGLIMMFTTVGFESIALKAYYVFSSMLYYLGYTMYNVPYYVMPGEMTPNPGDRVELRGFATFFMNVGLIFSGTLPVLIAGYIQGKGASEGEAWHWTVLMMAIVAFISITITTITIKGKESFESENVNEENECEKENFLKSIFQVVKIRSYRIIVLASMFFYAVFTLFWAALWYFMTSNLLLTEGQSATIYTVNLVAAFIAIAGIMIATKKLDKKEVLTGGLLIGGSIMCIFAFIGVDSYFACGVLVAIYTLAATCYWTLVYPLFYDLYEVDDLVYGKRREATMFSWFSFLDKVAAAIAIQGLGIALSMSNYNGDVVEQVPEALKTIFYSTTLVPGILIILTAICIIKYPINKNTYKTILKNLELKKAGKEYSTEGLEKII